MKIDKAIESLSNLLKRYDFIDAKETHQAVKLGIEALAAVQAIRQGTPSLNLSRLPSETTEEGV